MHRELGAKLLAAALPFFARPFHVIGRDEKLRQSQVFARCLVHETDHVNGTLYLDHLSGRQRRAALREMEVEKDRTWASWDERARALGKE